MSDATPSTDARVAPALPHQPPPARRVSLFKSASLGTRLGMVMAVLLASIATFLAAYLPAEFDRLGRLGFLEQTEGIARMLATASEAALDFDDALSASRQLEALSSLPDVNYARLLRPDGTTLAGLHPERMPGDLPLGAQEMQSRLEPRAVQVVVPVPSRSGHPGALAVGFSLDALEKARARASLRVLEVSAAVLLFGLLAAAALGTLLTTPLRRVTSVAERIADGDAGARGDLELDRRDEVGRLAQAFDLMLQRLFGQRGRIDAPTASWRRRWRSCGAPKRS